MFRMLTLFVLGSVILPGIYERQATILGFDAIPKTSVQQHSTTLIDDSHIQTAYFAAGAYSYAESVFEDVPGVAGVVPGIMRHDEDRFHTVKVTYNPDSISYKTLLTHYWRHIDPTDKEGQFTDRGEQFRTAVFYGNSIDRVKAAASFSDVKRVYGRYTATLLLQEGVFYPAKQEYHDYAAKHPATFSAYMDKSGRLEYLPVLRNQLDG